MPRLFQIWARADRWHVALALGLLIWFITALVLAHEAIAQARAYRIHIIQQHVLPNEKAHSH